ncbi:YbjN domain-containing protein [Epibacterium ulvae]|uniref:YbjN domain-containing protein n=1 Tax=Epibacterium ulvae TaxID=1156985 RepID=UPI001BFCABF0|nr:YbjN domain-containing protein [Epibacterium ulvae]MBT8153357.1 YbjN domain-containing protein [Epibacterium ulvae]
MNFIAKTLGAICLSTGLIAGAVSAQESNITALTPGSLSTFLDGEEIAYEQSVDDVGDPKFDVDYYGIEFSVFYYGCRDNVDCDSIQFFSGYDVNGGIRLSKINSWNKDNRNARAYISDNGSVWVEQDVFLGQHGLHPDDFAKAIGVWTGVQKEFETYIGW